jgi:predicted NACHT family NTPase
MFSKAHQTTILIGAPGVGKTATMQELMNRLTQRRREENQIAIGYIFFSSQQELDTDAGAILMHLLHTLCVGTKHGHEMLEKLHRLTEETESLWVSGERKPSLKEIRNTLIETVKKADEACIFIDALDECKKPEQLEYVLSIVREIQIESGVGVVMTDRPGENAALERCFEQTENCIRKEVRAHDEDIKAYVEGCIREHGKVNRLDETGLKEAVDVIQRVSGGM